MEHLALECTRCRDAGRPRIVTFGNVSQALCSACGDWIKDGRVAGLVHGRDAKPGEVWLDAYGRPILMISLRCHQLLHAEAGGWGLGSQGLTDGDERDGWTFVAKSFAEWTAMREELKKVSAIPRTITTID